MDLTPLEEKVVATAAAGEMVEVSGGSPDMEAWEKERTVRAAVLRHLLVAAQWPVDEKGFGLRGVRISGRLDLRWAAVRCPLLLHYCYLDGDEPIRLDFATALRITLTKCQLPGLSGEMLAVRELDLSGSTLTGVMQLRGADIAGQLICRDVQLKGIDSGGNALAADGLKVGGGMFLNGQFTAAGAVRLGRADITGELGCQGAQLKGVDSEGNALYADGLQADGGVFLDEGFTAAGAVRLSGAYITGQLVCRGAKLTGTNSQHNALVADWIKARAVFLDGGFTAAGAVRLSGANITGQLNCDGAQLTGADNEQNALVAEGMAVAESVFLGGGFTAAGAIRLLRTEIAGQLICRDAQLTRADPAGIALYADGMKVGRDVFIDRRFTADGAVRLVGANISGQFACRSAQLRSADSDGNSLYADGMRVGGGLFLDDGFTAAGAVRLPGVDITGQLACHGARLTGADSYGNALAADGIRVSDTVFLDRGFTANGTLSLVSALVGGSVYLKPTELVGEDKVALVAARAQIAGTLVWEPEQQISGTVSLEGATVGHLEDDWSGARHNGYWPTDGRLRLDGFTYGRFGGHVPPGGV